MNYQVEYEYLLDDIVHNFGYLDLYPLGLITDVKFHIN